MAAVATVLALAGCAAAPGPQAQAPPVAGPAEPAVAVDGGTGHLAGRVLAAEPIAGAIVTLSGLPHAVATDQAGAFRFSLLRPSTYLLEVRASGYMPGNATVQVVAGDVSTVEVSLLPDVAASTGPLVADFWLGRDEVVVADGTYSRSTGHGAVQDASDFNPAYGFCRSDAQTTEDQLVPIHFDDIHQLAWPGTAQARVEVSWDPLLYPGTVHLQLDPTPGIDMAVSPDLANGGSHTFEIPAEWNDLPYQRFSTWELGICPGPSLEATPWDDVRWPQVLDFDAKVTLVRGHPLPELAPPKDLYGNETRLVILDELRQGSADLFDQAYLALPHDRTTLPGVYRFEPPRGVLVPPGTAHLDVHFEWDWAGDELSLSFDSASLHPRFHNDWRLHQVPAAVEAGDGYRVYRIPLTADDWDGTDDNRTAWRFYWNLEGAESDPQGQIPPGAWSIGVRVVAVSEKDRGP